ncbi:MULTISPECIES: NADPH-dependent FMN reductase [Chelativorans]|uniref:NADPH-dependent FMN reductase n=1 Tax=Chelativorans sp. (strain BNC1) TaxID=266779 RepID=Q11BZ6_CHESB|nr:MULTISPECIES: NAD(P)H-dependent oxidoreductase [Chelativorans]
MSSRPLIVGIGGSTRPGSSSEMALRYAMTMASNLGADIEIFDGAALSIPMYAPEIPFRTAEAQKLIAALQRADGVILSSPGYHGSVSGMLKNALDYVEDLRSDVRPYFEGRPVGCIVCASGWQAVGTTLTGLRSVIHALRGWPTPLGVGINTAVGKAFSANGDCLDEAVRGQLTLLSQQVLDFLNGEHAKWPARMRATARKE